jgi:PAS domain S-box-containing protein
MASARLKSFYRSFLDHFSPSLEGDFCNEWTESLQEINVQRVKIFSLLMFIFCMVFCAGLDLFYLLHEQENNKFIQTLLLVHLGISVFYLLVYIFSYQKIFGKPDSKRLLVYFFTFFSMLISILISVMEEEMGATASVYLLTIAALLVIFYWSLFESLFLLLAGNIIYFTVLFYHQENYLIFSSQLVNTLIFSLIFFLISRSIFKIKLIEFDSLKKAETHAELLFSKNLQLEKAQFTLASLNKNLMQGLFRLNHEGKLIYINEFLLNLFDFDSTESMIKHWNLRHILPLRKISEIVTLLKSGELVKDFEFEYFRSDGSQFWGLINCSVETDPITGLMFYDGSIIDNTERKNNERMLQNLSLVASKTDNAVFIIDQQEKIEWVNEGFTRLTGYTFDEAKGKKPGILFQGKNTDPETIRKIGQKISKGKGFMGEMLNYRKDGSEYWAYMNINPVLNEKREIQKYIAVETDITERKLVEQELIKAKDAAVKLIQVKEEFLSMVSHELRTPLNAVIGMSHVLLQENPREDQLQNITTLKFSAEYLLSLINDILDFSKIEAGKIAIEKTNFNLYNLVESVRQTFLYQAKEKNIEFLLHMDPDVSEYVIGDPVRINQVITNLISNAIKFTDQGQVELSIVSLYRNEQKVNLEIKVEDSGIGIPHQKLNSIFDRFEQASDSTTRKRGGTGLGLAITKSLVEIMNGQIKVYSESGRGSVFKVLLPLEAGRAEDVLEKQPNSGDLENFRGYSLLLAEDNKINQMVAIKFLKLWEINFEVAENGAEAVELARKNNYDLILMDLQMPELDGFEATKIIRGFEEKRFQELPIIALTAASLEIREKVYNAGMNDFLIKPFNPAELHAKLKKFLLSNNWHKVMMTQSSDHKGIQNDELNLDEMKRISSGDHEFLLELLSLSISQLRNLPVKIISVMEKEDHKELFSILHKIKPSIKMINYTSLEQKMDDFTRSVYEGQPDSVLQKKRDEFLKVVNNVEWLLTGQLNLISSFSQKCSS